MEKEMSLTETNNIESQSEEKSLSSRLKSLLENPKLLSDLIKTKPKWFDSLDDETPASAIAGSLIGDALKGDKKAIELIQKIAYGDRVVIDTAPGFFDSKDITITIIDPKHKEDGLNEEDESK